jgi:hypothetical protein
VQVTSGFMGALRSWNNKLAHQQFQATKGKKKKKCKK